MDLLNRAYAQLNDLFRSLTPGSRVIAGLLLLIVVISMSYLFAHQTATPDVDLLPGIPVARSQLANMQAAFHKANLKDFEVRDTSIRVRRGEEAAYMSALCEAKALPPDFTTAMHEAINSDSMLTGNQQRVQKWKVALQEMLALSIRQKLGAENVCVTYESDTKPGLTREKQITALVSIKPARESRLDETQVLDIRYLVAAAILGLKPDNVTVADLSPSGRTWYGKLDNANGLNDKLYSAKRAREEDIKLKILAALWYIPDVTVGVNVELVNDRNWSPRAQANREATAAAHRDAAANVPQTAQGTPPAATQQTTSNVAAVVGAVFGDPSVHRTEKPVVQNMPCDVLSDAVEPEIPAFTPKQAKVLIGIPNSYFKKIWHDHFADGAVGSQTGPDQAAFNDICREQSAKIRQEVSQLLPLIDGVANPMDQVAVTTFDYPVAAEPQTAAWQQISLRWLEQHAGMASLVTLALVSLMVLWSMVRTGAAEMRRASLLTASVATTGAEDDFDAAPAQREPHAFRAAARHDELSDVVRRNPNAAANILRTWVGHSG